MKVSLKWLLLILSLIFMITAEAHTRSESFSEWRINNEGFDFLITVPENDVIKLLTKNPQTKITQGMLVNFIQSSLAVTQINKEQQVNCATDKALKLLPSREGYIRIHGSLKCQYDSPASISMAGFFDNIATHTHYALVITEDNNSELVFTKSQYKHSIQNKQDTNTKSTAMEVLIKFITMGASHIFFGLDHLAFLLALLLIAKNLRETVWLVSGFSIGHTLSIVLASLRVIEPNSMMVESMIGFTILLVIIEAASDRVTQKKLIPLLLPLLCLTAFLLTTENLKVGIGLLGASMFSFCYLFIASASDKKHQIRLLITSVFGVIHGLGFAGGLLSTNMATDTIIWWLLGFNIGIELGQLLIVSVLLTCSYYGKKHLAKPSLSFIQNACFTSLSALGTYWFLTRVII